MCRVFFFKQKTAYEMRISDGSSDVCSSDLDGGWGEPVRETDAVLLAGPSAAHVDQAREHMAQGRPVVSCADGLDDAQALLDLGPEAAERGVPVVVGAGFSPGYTCLLARHAASRFDEIHEIHVARRGP